MLNIEKKLEDKCLTVVLDGRLDTTTAPDFDAELNNALEGADSLVLDCEKLEYISSAGLRVLLAAQKVMNTRGGMKLIRVNDIVNEVFEVTGFANILTIE